MKVKASNNVALYGLTEQLTYAELLQRAKRCNAEIVKTAKVERPLVLLQLDTSINAVVAYLACLQFDLPVMLAAPEQDISSLCQRYHVNLHVLATEKNGIDLRHLDATQHQLHSELSVLLSTSGSTGSPKLVMLSKRNISSNAESICQYLAIKPTERALSSLPFYYSYGLSVLNSHLLASAAMVLGPADLLSKKLWQQAGQHSATSFAGVPFSYEMLLKLRLERILPDSITTLTQAGGRLAADKVKAIADFSTKHNKRFYVMYGQTEATARMAYLPSEEVGSIPNSIGCAIPNGAFYLKHLLEGLRDGQHQVGELYYRGPNIMLGYALELHDLCQKGVVSNVELATGDLAYCLDERYYIVGRLKRIIKLRGIRFSLDELELELKGQLEAEWLFCAGQDDKLCVLTTKTIDDLSVTTYLRRKGIHPSLVKCIRLDAPIYNQNGKPHLTEMMRADVE